MPRVKAAPAGETTAARILIACEFGHAGEHAEIPTNRVSDLVAQNVIDTHADAVAYAKAQASE